MIDRIIKFEVITANILIFLPIILILITGEQRDSISDYAYSKHCFLLPTLLSFAGGLFMFNGVASNKWYNIILGASLVGIGLTPHKDYPIWHYSFATLFFFGSFFVMIAFSSKEQRWWKWHIGIVSVIVLVFGFVADYVSLFYAEWIAILPITIHFIGESLNKID